MLYFDTFNDTGLIPHHDSLIAIGLLSYLGSITVGVFIFYFGSLNFLGLLKSKNSLSF